MLSKDIKELSGSNFLLNALESKRKGSENEYLNLVQLIKTNTEKAVLDTQCVSQWLLTFIRHISLLRQDCRSLVEQVLKLRWVSQDDCFCEIFHRFVVHLVSAHPAYVFEVIERITKYFLHTNKIEEAFKAKAKERLHLLLKEVIVLVPTSTTHLCKRLISLLPIKDNSLGEHVAYTEHLLLVARYIPMLRDQLLTALMNRILQLDSEIQIEVDELKEIIQEEAPGDVFFMEADEPSDDEDSSDAESISEIKNTCPRAIEVMIQKLDAMLNLVLEFVKTFDFSQQEGYGLFYHMVHIFNASIIRTFKSRHAQFVMFYLCSLHSRFSDAFLGVLFDHLASPDAPQVTRIASVAYLSSFTARAKFVEDSDVRKVASLLLNWLGSYMESTPSVDIRLDPTRHALFYATTQAALYLFCFRWRSFRLQSGEWDPCIVPLRHILHSSFRPLKVRFIRELSNESRDVIASSYSSLLNSANSWGSCTAIL
ncbi:DNA independent RNA polymerase I transcription factor, variant 2 [Entomophthora muscae]|uniref:DNA independent RNA polymerase I transcription factor, variant 2 n=1 Tax=Entomophthora muscae TaxID=34485 RepID=A0ACC2RM21_9FUNG|nr:DNA independent RNA polymerase I transcription factor, variant 2 [Entomophthora muscae]